MLNQTCRCLYKWRRGGQMSKSPSQAFKIQTSTAVPTQNRGSEAPLRWGPRVSSLVSKYTLPNTKDTSSNTKYTLLYIYQIHITKHQIHTPKKTKYTFPNTRWEPGVLSLVSRALSPPANKPIQAFRCD